MKHRSWIHAILLCATSLSAQGMDFDPTKLSRIDFNDEDQQKCFEPLCSGRSFSSFIGDGNSLQFPIQLLAQHFGYTEAQGWRVIDISYEGLKRYARRFLDVSFFSDLEGRNSHNLCTQFSKNCLDTSSLSSADNARFCEVLERMASSSAGRAHMQSLIVMQYLIDHRLGEIGDGFLQGKRLAIKNGRMDCYRPYSYRVEIDFDACAQNGPDNENILLQIVSPVLHSPDEEFLLDLSVGFLHEFIHVYNGMLSFEEYDCSSKSYAFNAVCAACLLDPYLRERFNPLLNKDVLDFVLGKIKERRLDQDMASLSFEDTSFYSFLEANHFFGNDWLRRRDLLDPEYKLWGVWYIW
jgi:hypothetical protein